MKSLYPLVASSALALVLAASGPSFAQSAMGAAGSTQTAPTGATNASTSASAKVPVANIPNPQQIAGAPVVDSSGKQFGRIIKVMTGSGGKAERVQIGFTTQDAMGRAASVKAEKLTLDASKQAVVADLSPAQVAQLASTASTMGPGAAAGAGGAAAGGASAGGGGKGQ